MADLLTTIRDCAGPGRWCPVCDQGMGGTCALVPGHGDSVVDLDADLPPGSARRCPMPADPTPISVRLDNGTAWPNPDRVRAAFDRMPVPAAHWREIGAPMTDEERTALHDYWTIRELVSAYEHLTRHPAGTESAVASLRLLRRAVRKNDAR